MFQTYCKLGWEKDIETDRELHWVKMVNNVDKACVIVVYELDVFIVYI